VLGPHQALVTLRRQIEAGGEHMIEVAVHLSHPRVVCEGSTPHERTLEDHSSDWLDSCPCKAGPAKEDSGLGACQHSPEAWSSIYWNLRSPATLKGNGRAQAGK